MLKEGDQSRRMGCGVLLDAASKELEAFQTMGNNNE
jgi:hypothetical protein